jgi:hypothetical protein
LNIFGKKQIVRCSVCNKELGRHKYRPAKEWNIGGLLCADCHIDKTKDFMERQQRLEKESNKCAVCAREISSEEDRNKPKWQWEMESGVLVCKTCYQKKDAEYNKRISFCAACNGKLELFFYHPKPSWKIEGNLCRRCWDGRNRRDN